MSFHEFSDDNEDAHFEIVSVEDKSKCKLPISVPGITVNVKRLKVCYSSYCFVSRLILLYQPTVKFYGSDGKRHVTVLEHESADLPLRLTGESVNIDCSII